MKSSAPFSTLTLGVMFTLSIWSQAFAVPATGPLWENPRGLFALYFQNIATTGCTSPSVIMSFDNTSTPNYLKANCVNVDTLIANYLLDNGIGGGSSQWDDIAGGINYAWGNVGIGTNTPAYKLEVAGWNLGLTDGFGVIRKFNDNASDWPGLIFARGRWSVWASTSSVIGDKIWALAFTPYNGVAWTPSAEIGAIQSGDSYADGTPSDLYFTTVQWGATYERMRVTSTGNVGIGTSTPDKPFHVVTSNPVNDGNQGIIVAENTSPTGNAGMNIRVTGPNTAAIQFSQGKYATLSNTGGALAYDVWSAAPGGPGFTLYTRKNSVQTAQMVIKDTGNVGIGTSTPTETLSVSGRIIASDPVASNNVATKGYVDGVVLSAAGGGGGGGGNAFCYEVDTNYQCKLWTVNVGRAIIGGVTHNVCCYSAAETPSCYGWWYPACLVQKQKYAFYDNGNHYAMTPSNCDNRVTPFCSDDTYDTLKLTYPEANTYCENMVYAGFDDWRLPLYNELLAFQKAFSTNGYTEHLVYLGYYWGAGKWAYSQWSPSSIVLYQNNFELQTFYVRCFRKM